MTDIRIRLYIESSYLCDRLSINEWNALFSRYEDDPQAKIKSHYSHDAKEADYFIIETTLNNVLSKAAVMDLQFMRAAKLDGKWTDKCLE